MTVAIRSRSSGKSEFLCLETMESFAGTIILGFACISMVPPLFDMHSNSYRNAKQNTVESSKRDVPFSGHVALEPPYNVNPH